MERNSYNGDFERFLRDNANEYRMYPSDKVWNGIHSSLHVRPKWYRLSALLLLFSFLATGILFIFSLKKTGNENLTTQEDTFKNTDQPFSDSSPAGNKVAKKNMTDIFNSSFSFNQRREDKNTNPVSVRRYTPSAGPVEAGSVESGSPVFADLYPETTPEEMTISAVEEPAASSRVPGSFSRIASNKEEKKPLETISLKSLGNAPNATPKPLDFIRRARKKIDWQVHFTPTVSYRKLSENNKYRPVGTVNYTSLLNVNEAVNHKPDIGFEIGIDARYHLSNRLRAKIGLQSNVTRYEIRAYSSRSELTTITLNSTDGTSNQVNAISNFRNFGGNTSNWLENIYVQLSVPLGIDYIISENNGTQFGISSSLQPTYLLGRDAYLISADYKNYVKVPELIRRWNVNADFETFISYSTGKIRWQVGPQVRYQIFSSFVNSYPVRENLFDFGLKLGMSLNNR